MDAELMVSRAELIDAVTAIACAPRAIDNAQAVLTFDGEALHIELPGVSMAVSATGEWNGQARFAAGFMDTIAQTPPDRDPVPVVVDGDRVKIDGYSIAATWERSPATRVTLPLNAPTRMVLAIKYNYTIDDIERSGLTDVVNEAEKRRDLLITRAAHELEELGVSRGEIRALVEEKLKQTVMPL